MTLYNTNVDLVNVNVYTKFGLIPSIHVKILSKNRNRTESQTDRMTDGQGESSIAPLFSSPEPKAQR